MSKWIISAAGAMGLAIFASAFAPAQAMTMKACSAKYKAVKKAGTLNGMKWKDFRKAQCGAEASAAPAPSSNVNPMTSHAKRAAANSSAAPSSAAPSGVVFPKAVSPKFSKESAGLARRHTCLAQYYANKASNGNGGLKWIQKGGGYYSECVKHLKSL